MDKHTLATIIQEGSKIVSSLLNAYPLIKNSSSLPSVKSTQIKENGSVISTEDTIRYQRREISKELLLLEKHLQQGCKIDGKACDCCEKHPITIEALAQESMGMVNDPVFKDVAKWSRSITSKTTQEAAASGDYEDEYPRLAIKARELRKSVMGTDSVEALTNNEGGQIDG